ncbi:fatty acid--CoA ligase [Campylobacter hyointestinalis]|uniref:fatty acid--CoA ligase n=1 Tax=Campylobacter hyointestinalis TaxID=198 RepID=UPI000CE552AE|nr:fatty acid--CoA ligase [Campylobacter hyointestinalis]PPB55129.1 long-chain fatty acid--CoA ligase [Campylobacter hyointestinalis subsp. hyointestinalis]PPB60412.1 long-chain fatty acid--CoA ligase [Campylobacter hyointestinalis subsp. hyointestinalis]PPB61541.1 long-chain fatty acid--CoA ligase [Campylobacter hyointestinalis subsp. hyointestinalis]
MEYKFNNYYEMLDSSASLHPKNIAIFSEKAKLSYKELKLKVDQTITFLRDNQIAKNDKVAMIVTNCEEFVISFFAITAIGAIPVPINTFLKKDEFRYILNDCQAKMLIVSNSHLKEIDGLEASSLKVVVIGEFENSAYQSFKDAFYRAIDKDFVSPAKLEDTASIIYTSGTTGHPKGAVISYKNVFSNIIGINEIFSITHKDRFIVYLPMFHSFTLTVMVIMPIYSASSEVIVKSVFPFSNVLKQTLLKRVTVFLGVPAIYSAIAKAKIPWYFKWFNAIRYFVCGSAPLAKQTIDDFERIFPRAKLLEGYGLSECSPLVSVNRPENKKVSSVGLPLPKFDVKIVDDEMIEMKTGEVGEIIVKGDNVMQGYLNNPTATDEVIINGWLRTGDLGKVDSDGFLYIVDRLKDLIISKGQNIYPREIEELIYKIEEVEACAVIGIKDENEDEDVVAFIQLKEDMVLSEAKVKAFLKNHLANFKIPKHVYFADELPKNAAGKVLKRVLKENIKGKIN